MNAVADVRTWEQPPPSVNVDLPSPWVYLGWGEEEEAFVYVNERLFGPGCRITRMPTVDPPVFDKRYAPVKGVDGQWMYVDLSTGERRADFVSKPK